MKRMGSFLVLGLCAAVLCSGASCSSNASGDTNSEDATYAEQHAYHVCEGVFAYSTPVAVGSDQFANNQSLILGDAVMESSNGSTWQATSVHFISAVEPGTSHEMIYLTYTKAGGQPEEMIVAPNTCFLLTDGSLKYASHLTIADQIRMANGGAASVGAISAKLCSDGVVAIRVTPSFDTASDKYLNYNGLVSTEYFFDQW